uniref:Uncharacterized protein n=1 Tax=Hanusia phi TaxID=3032 RepID=A0A7S0EHW4_9CRYP
MRTGGMCRLSLLCAWYVAVIPFNMAIHVGSTPSPTSRSRGCHFPCALELSRTRDKISGFELPSQQSWPSLRCLRGGSENSTTLNVEVHSDNISSISSLQNGSVISNASTKRTNSTLVESQAPKSKLMQWWRWRQDQYFESLWTELGMIMCPRSTVLASFVLGTHLSFFVTNEETVSPNLHPSLGVLAFAGKCVLSPKLLLLPYLFQMNVFIGLFSLLISIDDMFTFIMNPQSVVLNEVLSAIGIALLATFCRAIVRISGAHFPSWLRRISDIAIYADPSLIYLLLVSPSINIAKALRLMLLNINPEQK